ncbi:MAG: 3-deoxy-7-phosphoheptulonate synthase [Candidatus Woesearchaeota archaeon]|jgi:3-deoxy-7-phosphoheptulonate synthase|nr:3-deoxy-7-phosphoheptulonate synthase [Candidatus Woesearchaeota archaeon]MDP7458108.1 3-deoxy-7-phosphoheptulonate synthase [Candidatus Woesearchaeota archaeon]
MIIVMKKEAKKENIENAIHKIESLKLRPVPLVGTERTVIAIIGDERILPVNKIKAMPGVEKVMEVLKPYKLASKEGKKASKVRVGDVVIGGQEVIIIAGPCAVESEKQIVEIAKSVKKSGAKILRGGAYKPRTGPYDFQGLGEKGLKLLAKARDATGLKIVTEVIDPRDVELVSKYTDILQVGTRNMQNYPLLKEVGKTKMPVLLKRGMWANYKELLLAAEYIMAQGNREVILCERGVRTFETYTRNTLDINAVPSLKELTHLPVIVDPSHGTGKKSLVTPMSRAAVAAGADGLIIETHCDPENAIVDADQTIDLDEFAKLMKQLDAIAKVIGRKI